MKHAPLRYALAIAVLTACQYSYGQDAEQSGLPKDVKQSMEYIVGNWSMEGTLAGEEVRGRMSVRWAPGGEYALLFNWTMIPADGNRESVQRGTMVGGYDPLAKEIVEHGFDADGNLFTNRYPIAKDMKDNVPIPGKRVDVRDGKKTEGDITLIRKGPKEFSFTVTTEGSEATKIVFRKLELRRRQKVEPDDK
jgi:hypothetical protein